MKYSMRVTCRFLNPVINDRIARREGYSDLTLSKATGLARARDNSPAILLCTHTQNDQMTPTEKNNQKPMRQKTGRRKKHTQ